VTVPKITYGHGYFNDGDDASEWTETESSLTAADDAGDEYAHYWATVPNVSSNTYPTFAILWKTSDSSNALGARVSLNFDDATDQTILGASAPQFSTSWEFTTGTITPGKTIEKIRLWADDYPNTIAAGESSVLYDFVMLCRGTFTFPYAHVHSLQISNRYADIIIPGRVGDIQQYLGMESPTIRLSGDMKHGIGTWGGSLITYGEFLYRLFHEAHNDPCQWFDSDLIKCKVTPRDFNISQEKDSGAQRTWELLLKHYSLSSGVESEWNNTQWFGFR